MEVHKSFFQIGLFDPLFDDVWPWHFHYENGVYLSKKYRKCGWNSSAEFESPKDAREFYHNWKHREKFKMELIEVKRWVTVPDPVFPPDHPRSIIEKIRQTEKCHHARTAIMWFMGMEIKDYMTKPTLLKHKAVLLKYGVDIETECLDRLEPLVSSEDVWQLSKPDLDLI
ncbi:MAG: hypothetical protein HRT38_07365 [Alteromonadaceae bacterium]|nr:hypothetical protein [Alteromonadaceae bacterium]